MTNYLNLQVIFWILVSLIVFNFILLVWLWRLTNHYNRLIRNTNHKSLINLLEGIQKTLAQHEKKLLRHRKSIDNLQLDFKKSLQKVILHRFNPFQHTGGKQSFILALLDGHKNGVIITSLHSRENTRFYVKSIKEGEGVDIPLSPEEEKLIRHKGVAS